MSLNTSIIVRKLTAADLEQLQLISEETFYESYSEKNTVANMKLYMQQAFSLKTLLDELNNSDSTFYFVLLEAKAIGYLKLNRGNAQTSLQHENSLELARIYIGKEFQHNRIGKKLLNKAIETDAGKKLLLSGWVYGRKIMMQSGFMRLMAL